MTITKAIKWKLFETETRIIILEPTNSKNEKEVKITLPNHPETKQKYTITIVHEIVQEAEA